MYCHCDREKQFKGGARRGKTDEQTLGSGGNGKRGKMGSNQRKALWEIFELEGDADFRGTLKERGRGQWMVARE